MKDTAEEQFDGRDLERTRYMFTWLPSNAGDRCEGFPSFSVFHLVNNPIGDIDTRQL